MIGDRHYVGHCHKEEAFWVLRCYMRDMLGAPVVTIFSWGWDTPHVELAAVDDLKTLSISSVRWHRQLVEQAGAMIRAALQPHDLESDPHHVLAWRYVTQGLGRREGVAEPPWDDEYGVQWRWAVRAQMKATGTSEADAHGPLISMVNQLGYLAETETWMADMDLAHAAMTETALYVKGSVDSVASRTAQERWSLLWDTRCDRIREGRQRLEYVHRIESVYDLASEEATRLQAHRAVLDSAESAWRQAWRRWADQ